MTSRLRFTALRVWLLGATILGATSAAVAVAAPAPPTGLSATTPTNTAPRLTWNAVPRAKHYKVLRNGTVVAKPTTPSYTDTGVRTSGTYSYKVQVVTTSASRASPAISVVYDVTPPSVPTGVRAASPTSSAPSISWAASSDTHSGIAGYRVFRDGAPLADVAGSPYTDASLTAPGTYAYAVAAIDRGGNVSPRSATVSVTYESAEPPPPPPSGGPGYSGVSSRLTGVDASGTSGAEKDAHPELKLVSVLLRWRSIEAGDGNFNWGPLDASLEDAAGRGYKIVVRILAGADAPGWLYTHPERPVTKMSLLGSDPAASYKGEMSVPLPWDPDLEFHYRNLLRALDAHLRLGDTSGGILRDEVYFVPVAMPSVHGSEMAVGYGTGTYTGTYKGVYGTYDRAATNRAEWRAHASSGTTDAERDAAVRRDLEDAWRRAIDAHMEELTIVPSSIAYGPQFSDAYAAAKAIASSKVAQYPARLWSMTTNLQPKVYADGTLGPYSAWSTHAHQAIRNAIDAGGRIGFQTAGPTIINSAAKMQAAIDEGIDTYGARFLEVAPEMVDRYGGMLLTDPDNAQARMEAIYGP